MVMLSAFSAVSEGDSESVTLTTKSHAAIELGTPHIVPRGPSFSLLGRLPKMIAHVYGRFHH